MESRIFFYWTTSGIFFRIGKHLVPSVSFSPYFCLFVFGILVILDAWFYFRFFLSSPFCLANVNKDYLIFLYSYNSVAKSDQKQKIGWRKYSLEKSQFGVHKLCKSSLNSRIKLFKIVGIQIFLLLAVVCNIELTLGFCLLLRYRKVTILRRTGS